MTSRGPVWLGEADVVGLISLPEAIESVERALACEADGTARTMAKTYVAWEGGATLHALGGAIGDLQVAGTKTWVHAASAAPILAVWDAGTGLLRGVLEAFALGQLRTAAVSAVATRWLARPGADRMAIIGTGRQALAQVAAVAAVRPLREVRVYSPTPAHRAAFVTQLSMQGFGFEVAAAGSIAEAVAGAAIVTTATRARSPFLEPSMLEEGAHVNAIGAITPERSELAPDLVRAADRVVADHPDDARRVSGELAERAAIEALGAVVARRSGRAAAGELTLFKAVGLGLADVAIAAEVLRRAAARRVGRALAPAVRVPPRWRETP